METTDERRRERPGAVELEADQDSTAEQAAGRPKSGVLGFGASAATYFVVVVLLALVFVVVIFAFSR